MSDSPSFKLGTPSKEDPSTVPTGQNGDTSDSVKNASKRPNGLGIPMESNVFYNEETHKYMRIIDMYKKLGIGKDIELPRLVIAGAQSCGKSSLLENLTGLPVPITSGIGTRFPIEITLIEDPKKFQIKPSIILDPRDDKLSLMDKEKVQKFNLGKVYNEPMVQSEFEDLLRDASEIVGVPPPVFARDQIPAIKGLNNNTSLQISSHVLQIEMRGPDFKSLSFVDTPGLYHSGNSDQDATSVVDIEKLVVSLIEEKRTVIVAVMEASQSTVAQKIFKYADDVDTHGERTIGVLTKCDLVVTSDTDAFEATLRRARNQERVLHHGWYIVKNRSSTEAKAGVKLDVARSKESMILLTEPWSSSGINPNRMGIDSLRTGLSNVFCAHIRAEFPAFNEQTRNILKAKQSQLAQLGAARSSVAEQKEYLRTIVSAYQDPKNKVLREDFSTTEDLDSPSTAINRRLGRRKKAMLRDQLKNNGAVFQFMTPLPIRDDFSDQAASATYKATTTNIYTWINRRYQTTKSCAIPGIIPYPLLERLFEEQTVNWLGITDSFIAAIEHVFTTAFRFCLAETCKNTSVLASLGSLIVEKIREKMGKLKRTCADLIENERKGFQVVACEDQFVNDIREAKTLRFISALAKLESSSFLSGWTLPSAENKILESSSPQPGGLFGKTSSTPQGGLFANSSSTAQETPKPSSPFSFPTNTTPTPRGFGTAPTKSPNLFDKITEPLTTSHAETSQPQPSFTTLVEFVKDNQAKLKEVLTHDRQIVYEIHDVLKAYYSTSVQHYTDMVCKSVLTEKYVHETMDLFSNEFVDNLPDSEISRIAAESAADRKTRRELKEDIERLELAISQSEAILKEPIA